MSIDEAIKKHKKLKILAEGTNDKRGAFYSAEEHEQLAEWLEELKAYREIGTVEECKGCVLEILEAYNKAIDNFVNACKSNILCQTFGLRQCDIEEMAEQLKAGGENEQSI